MALLIPPKILFLDEISNGVDPITRKNLYAYLNSLNDTAIFLITHRIDEAEKICDTIAIMVGGKIRDIGSTKTLQDRHGMLYLLQVEVSNESEINHVDEIIQNKLPFCKPIIAKNRLSDIETVSEITAPLTTNKLTYFFDELNNYNRGNTIDL